MKKKKKIVIINFFTPDSLYTKKNKIFRIFCWCKAFVPGYVKNKKIRKIKMIKNSNH